VVNAIVYTVGTAIEGVHVADHVRACSDYAK
jgi:hypothetical protein